MKIFISWSGERSQALADAIKDWLKPILHFAHPWLSTADIKSGDRWSIEIAKELQDTNFGILCVTSDNLNAPWLLFEAGALAKSIDDGRVIPLLLDLEKSDLSGPLTQFQAEKTDMAGIKKLAESLNKAAATPISDETLQTLFAALWPQLEAKLSSIAATTNAQKKVRPQAEVLEELVDGVRSVEMRVRDVLEEGPDYRARRRHKYHPEMIMEIRHRIADGPNDPIQILILASAFKDEAPWFYELALDVYRSTKFGNSEETMKAYRRFREAAEVLKRAPFLEAFGRDSKMLHMMLMDTLEFMPILDLEFDDGVRKSASGKRKTTF
jgi:hypothetical protein